MTNVYLNVITLLLTLSVFQEEYVLNRAPLLQKAVEVAQRHGLKGVTEECFPYLAQAIVTHLVGLLKAMSKAAGQRADPSR
jgi:hypothetical protein